MQRSFRRRLQSDNADIERELYQLGLRDSPPTYRQNPHSHSFKEASRYAEYSQESISARASSLDNPLTATEALAELWLDDIRSSSAPVNAYDRPSPHSTHSLGRPEKNPQYQRLSRTLSLGTKSLNDVESVRPRSSSYSGNRASLVERERFQPIPHPYVPAYFRQNPRDVQYPGYVQVQDFTTLPKGSHIAREAQIRAEQEAGIMEKELVASVEAILRKVHAGIQESYIKFEHSDTELDPPPPQPQASTLRDPPPSPEPPHNHHTPPQPMPNGDLKVNPVPTTRLVGPDNASLLSKQLGFKPIQSSSRMYKEGSHHHHHHHHKTKSAPNYHLHQHLHRQKSSKAMKRIKNVAAINRGSGIKILKIKRNPNWGQGFGFSIKGSLEGAGLGVYVSRVDEESPSWAAGLRPGDLLLAANGSPVSQMGHTQIIHLLKTVDEISLTVATTSTVATSVTQKYSWLTPDGRPAHQPSDFNPRLHRHQVLSMKIDSESSEPLGLMIRGGAEYDLGIFVTGVDPGSAAHKAGLQIGDQIVEVNGDSFLRVTHDTAVGILKYSRILDLSIRRVGKLPYSCKTYQPVQHESKRKPKIAVSGDESESATLEMIEVKSKSILSKQEHKRLQEMVIAYIKKLSSVQELLGVAKILLVTPEKLSLLTEIREVIRKEDLVKYDASVYEQTSNIYRQQESFSTLETEESFITPLERRLAPLELWNESADSSDQEGLPSPIYSPLLHPVFAETGTDVLPPCYDMCSSSNKHRKRYHDKECRRKSSSYKTSKSSRHSLSIDKVPSSSAHKNTRTGTKKTASKKAKTELIEKLQVPQITLTDPSKHTCLEASAERTSLVVSDEGGKFRICIPKSRSSLGIAIEGGSDTNHFLPRVINISTKGSAFEAGGLRVGQLILEVDDQSLQGKPHEEVARIIAEAWQSSKNTIQFLVTDRKKSPSELRRSSITLLSQFS